MRWLAMALLCTAAFGNDGEWEVLFDGTSTAKWTGGIGKPFPASTWSIEDGWLTVHGSGPSLYSTDPYTDFELEFEWRIPPGANTGVKYLARPGNIHPDYWKYFFWERIKGFTFTFVGLASAALLIALLRRRSRMVRTAGIAAFAALVGSWSVKVWTEVKDAEKYPPGLEYQIIDHSITSAGAPMGVQRTASLYDLLPASGNDPNPPGEINHGRIVVRGAAAEHWLNGNRVLTYRLGSPEVSEAVTRSKFKDVPGFGEPGEGYLELQNHSSEAYFRNIRVRRLTP
jgi:hypothetical protein